MDQHAGAGGGGGRLEDFKGGLLARLARLERVQAEIGVDGDSTVTALTRKIKELESVVEGLKVLLARLPYLLFLLHSLLVQKHTEPFHMALPV